ncbi:MAG: hypothetical protein P8L18_17290 [Verrucomicrobiota bacterium]|nr:hypothetical protein [Verrucomicrobiota bacterium]
MAEPNRLRENIFRSVDIALVTELKVVFHKMDINIWDVLSTAATKPFGYMSSRSRFGWTLYPDRSILPDLESTCI